MLGDWASVLVYLLFAALIAGSLLFASVVLGSVAARAGAAEVDAVRVGRLAAAASQPTQLLDLLLPDGDAVHRLRHRDRLPLPARREPRAARAASASSELLRVRRRCWPSATSTSGGRGRSSGSDVRPARAATAALRGHRHRATSCMTTTRRQGAQLGLVQLDLAVRLRPRVLRDGDDRDASPRATTSPASAPRSCARRRARPT